jgi:hypothetical protein
MFAIHIIVIFYKSFFKTIKENQMIDNFIQDEKDKDHKFIENSELLGDKWWVGLGLISVRVLVMIHGFAALNETPVKKEEVDQKILQV